MIVLDASAAIEIANDTPAGRSFRMLFESGEEVCSCELVHAEVTNAYWKYAKAGFMSVDEARARAEAALGLIDRFCPLGDLDKEVLGEAVLLAHPAYDVYYLVLARRLGATLLTFDKKLNTLCDECGVSRVHEVSD